ncbi:unnamed protein product [Protopolystoma xenopodis]|uniref:Uncharacterized protein n=1 Tax=Protopolystoma xenopodis TaxID=117903 RepID=A0A3S5C8G6_9PLAT|nr:unnamed protein product [Protopolystoma xenopodis]
MCWQRSRRGLRPAAQRVRDQYGRTSQSREKQATVCESHSVPTGAKWIERRHNHSRDKNQSQPSIDRMSVVDLKGRLTRPPEASAESAQLPRLEHSWTRAVRELAAPEFARAVLRFLVRPTDEPLRANCSDAMRSQKRRAHRRILQGTIERNAVPVVGL